MKKTVLILFGGQSPEHEISLRSARNVVSALDTSKFDPILIGIRLDGQWNLYNDVPDGKVLPAGNPINLIPGSAFLFEKNEREIDVAFPVLHGPNGEDGTIQGLLRLWNIPFVGPGVLGSACSMDKDVAKKLLASAGIVVAPGATIRNGMIPLFSAVEADFGLPLFVKPANMGSSVGVHRVTSEREFESACADAFKYDSKVLIEQAIDGRELECAVLGLDQNLKVTAPGEISTDEEYSFEEKYSETSQARLDIPARDINPETVQELQKTAILAFRALNCEIMSRVDMFLTEDGKIYVNEVNTIPGFTNISMYPKLWENEGLGYTGLITELLDLAMKRG